MNCTNGKVSRVNATDDTEAGVLRVSVDAKLSRPIGMTPTPRSY